MHASRIFVLVLLVSLYPLQTTAQVSTVKGQIVVTRYDIKGQVRNQTQGTYDFSFSPTLYRIRALNPAEPGDRGELVVSDYHDIYQTEIYYSEKENIAQPALTSPRAYCKVDKGSMPNGFESYSVIQGLALTHLLITHFGDVTDSGALKDNFVPLIVRRRMRESSLPRLKTNVTLSPTNRELRVDFIGSTSESSGSDHSVILGLLESHWDETGLPAAVHFLLNNSLGAVISEANFTPTSKLTEAVDLLGQIAYEPSSLVSVQDSRFQVPTRLLYDLTPRDTPPFDQPSNKSYKRIVAIQTAIIERDHTLRMRQIFINVVLVAFISLAAFAVIRRFRTNTTISIRKPNET